MALTVKIRADATHFRKTIAGVEVQANGLAGVIGKLGSSSLAFGAALASAAAGAAALGASLAFIKSSSEKAAGMESLTMQFEVLTKSTSKSAELIKQFREEAIKSPLSVTDYAQAAKTLMAFGTSADSTLPILKMLGDVSMGNAERFGSLALAFAQTQAAGRLMGQEVLQFVNAGFNPLQEISRKTGRSMVELKKAMEDGAISSAMVTEAFRSATERGGLFFNAINKGAATTEGKMAKVRDAVDSLQIAFGTGFNNGLKTALDATSNFLPQIETQFAGLGNLLGEALSNAVKGDISLFVSIGIVIGEAIKAGFLDVAGNMIVETARAAIVKGSGYAGAREQTAAIAASSALLGNKRTISERTEGIMAELRPALEDMERTRARSAQELWGRQLEEQKRRVDRELLLENKKTNQLLEKMAPMKGLYPTSR